MMARRPIILRDKIIYGIGDIGNQVIIQMLTLFALFFYTDVFGISAAAAGTMMLIARVWDAVNDPIVGVVVDNTNSRYGKARPYLLYLPIPCAVLLVLTFTVPDMSPTGKLVWAYITYIGIGMAYTGTGIAHTTLLARMTDDSIERTKLNIFRMVMSIGPIMIIGAATIPLVGFFGQGDRARGFQYTVAFFSLFMMAAYWTAFTRKEQVTDATGGKNRLKLGDAFKSLRANLPWMMVSVSTLIAMTMAGLSSGSTMYYMTYYIKRPDLIPVLLPIACCAIFLIFPFVPMAARKLGKRNASLMGLSIYMASLLIRFVTKDSILPVYITCSLTGGLGLGFFMVLIVPMLADTVEYGEWRTGFRAEALIFSANSFGYKLGMGIGSAVLGMALSYSGYLPGVARQPESVEKMLFFLSVPLPMILIGLQMLILGFYKLDRIFPRVVAELKHPKQEAR